MGNMEFLFPPIPIKHSHSHSNSHSHETSLAIPIPMGPMGIFNITIGIPNIILSLLSSLQVG